MYLISLWNNVGIYISVLFLFHYFFRSFVLYIGLVIAKLLLLGNNLLKIMLRQTYCCQFCLLCSWYFRPRPLVNVRDYLRKLELLSYRTLAGSHTEIQHVPRNKMLKKINCRCWNKLYKVWIKLNLHLHEFVLFFVCLQEYNHLLRAELLVPEMYVVIVTVA